MQYLSIAARTIFLTKIKIVMKKQQSIPLVMLAIMMIFAARQSNLDKDSLPDSTDLSTKVKTGLNFNTLVNKNITAIEDSSGFRARALNGNISVYELIPYTQHQLMQAENCI